MSDSLPLVRVLVSKYPVLYQKSNCDNFDDAEEVHPSSTSLANFFWGIQSCSQSCFRWSLKTGTSASCRMSVTVCSKLDLQQRDQSYSFQVEQELRRRKNALQIFIQGSAGHSLASLDVTETPQKSLRINHNSNP